MKKTDKAVHKKNDKIEPFCITDDMLLDREMDEFLRQSMIEEADRLEEELNSDPELTGIGASDDLFLKIKARLQEMGAWEEEEDGEEELKGEPSEELTGGSKDKPSEELKKELKEKSSEELEEEAKEELSEKLKKESKEKPSEKLKEGAKEKPSEKLKEGAKKKLSEKLKKKVKEEPTKEPGPEIYQFLSEEDREALEIGRKIRTQRKKKGRYWKKAAMVTVVLAALFAVGMQGGASRNWILGALDRIMATTGNRLHVNYQDNQENIRSNEEREQEAWEKIKEELNIPVIEFFYKPKGMKFDKSRISKKTREATMFYWYEETIVQVYLESGEKNVSASFISEEEVALQDVIVSDQEIEIKIWNTTSKSMESYAVSFEYQDVLYFISGQIPLEEVEKMMRSIKLY